MNIVIGTVVLMALAAWAWQRLETPVDREVAFEATRRMVFLNGPRLVVALISAGLFAELLPDESVRAYLGDTSGMTGVLLGAVLGIVTPGGAFVSFALAAGATQAGASASALVAYISAWSLFALTKVITEELAFLGVRFILLRVVFTFPLPLIAGAVALVF
ncbi:MAG: permease [Pseudomonadota bacterium]